MAIYFESTKDENGRRNIFYKKKIETEPKDKTGFESIIIHFGGHYGKTVFLYPDYIKYYNTVHPSISNEAANFPPYYFKQNIKEISNDTFKRIVAKICRAGLDDIVGPAKERDIRERDISKTLRCLTSDGDVFEYVTFGNPLPQFNDIASIISDYCDFVPINPSWF